MAQRDDRTNHADGPGGEHKCHNAQPQQVRHALMDEVGEIIGIASLIPDAYAASAQPERGQTDHRGDNEDCNGHDPLSLRTASSGDINATHSVHSSLAQADY